MLHPSYADLMNVVNKDVSEDETPIVTSRYSIVMASAKRARQLVSGDEQLAGQEDEKQNTCKYLFHGRDSFLVSK